MCLRAPIHPLNVRATLSVTIWLSRLPTEYWGVDSKGGVIYRQMIAWWAGLDLEVMFAERNILRPLLTAVAVLSTQGPEATILLFGWSGLAMVRSCPSRRGHPYA